MLNLIKDILQEGRVPIEDGVGELPPFVQTTGVAQGDNLSPLLFIVLLSDLADTIHEKHDLVHTVLYADDAVIYSRSRSYLQKALKTLYSTLNGLKINVNKTKMMKFGRGGPPASKDIFSIDGQRIEQVNHFCYLGFQIDRRGIATSRHVTERIRKAKLAFCTIPNPRCLSLNTALRLFDLKIVPIATYGIKLTWNLLKAHHLEELDKLKASYLKRCMGLHKTSRNRKVYRLAGCPLLTEELQNQLELPPTQEFKKNQEQWQQKFSEIEADFYETPGMKVQWWREARIKQRHRITRGSLHGFHHLICTKPGFHTTSEECRCRLCGQNCELYHLYKCKEKEQFDWRTASGDCETDRHT